MKFNYYIPSHTAKTLENYLINGWRPGGFVESMLAMDMERALVVADEANQHAFCFIGRWILENAPEGSWGNYDNVRAWCENQDNRRTRWATWNTLITEPENDKDFSV